MWLRYRPKRGSLVLCACTKSASTGSCCAGRSQLRSSRTLRGSYPYLTDIVTGPPPRLATEGQRFQPV